MHEHASEAFIRLLKRSASVALAPLFLGVSITETRAADECGAASGGPPPSATCTSAGNPYASGITYSAGATSYR
jgi:hypothetical protein